MSEDHGAALRKELSGKPLPDLSPLAAEDLKALTEAVRRARRNQQAALQRAFEAALGHIPALLRGPVKKILLP